MCRVIAAAGPARLSQRVEHDASFLSSRHSAIELSLVINDARGMRRSVAVAGCLVAACAADGAFMAAILLVGLSMGHANPHSHPSSRVMAS